MLPPVIGMSVCCMTESEPGSKSLILPRCSPNLNAFAERAIQSLKQECLNHFVIFGQRHLDHANETILAANAADPKSHEWGYIYDWNTGKTVMPVVRGQPGSVRWSESAPTPEWLYNMLYEEHNNPAAKTVMTHVHPATIAGRKWGISFSPSDIITHVGIQNRFKTVAVAPTGEVYTLTRTSKTLGYSNPALVQFFRQEDDFFLYTLTDHFEDLLNQHYTADPGELLRETALALAGHHRVELYDKIGLLKYEAVLPDELYDMYDDLMSIRAEGKSDYFNFYSDKTMIRQIERRLENYKWKNGWRN